jgi:hypothetical protein
MRCKLNYEYYKCKNALVESFNEFLNENKDKWLECHKIKYYGQFRYRIGDIVWVFFDKKELIFEEDILKKKLEVICNEM